MVFGTPWIVGGIDVSRDLADRDGVAASEIGRRIFIHIPFESQHLTVPSRPSGLETLP